MRGANVIFHRETLVAWRSLATYVIWSVVMVCSGLTLIAALRAGDGGFVPLIALLAEAVGWWLPFLCALVTMRLFAAERASGTLETLLTAPVREWQVVWGKYVAAFGLSVTGLLLMVAVPLLLLPHLVPALAGGVGTLPLLLALMALLLQLALWCAVGLFFSLLWAHSVAALAATLFCCVLLPFAAEQALKVWYPTLALTGVGLPAGIWAAEVSWGMVSLAPWVCYVAATWCFIFLTVQLLEARQTRSS